MKKLKHVVILFCLMAVSIHQHASAICFAVKDSMVYASNGTDIFLSNDNGANWKILNRGSNATNFGTSIHHITLKGSEVYVGTYGNGVYKSVDNGSHWEEINIGNPSGTSKYSKYEIVLSLFVSENKLFALFDSKGLYFYQESSKSWVPSKPKQDVFMSSAACSANTIFIGQSDGIIYKKPGSTKWEKSKKGFPSQKNYVASLASFENGMIAGTGYQGVYISSDNGENWREANTGLPTGANIIKLYATSTHMYASTGGGLYFSADKGMSWTKSQSLPNGGPSSISSIGEKVYVEFEDLYSSVDGINWVKDDFLSKISKLAREEEYIAKTTAAVTKIKKEIESMIEDSNNEFIFNQVSNSTIFEDLNNKRKYYASTTKYKGEISLIQEQSMNSVLYKTLIFGWKIDRNTAQEDEDNANYVKNAAGEVIKQKVASGSFKTQVTKNGNGSVLTELRDSLGRRILETLDGGNYFQMTIFGKTWRTNSDPGISAAFTIETIKEAKNKKREIKSSYPFEFIGTNNQVSLYATSLGNDLIFAVDNARQQTVYVKIKITFQCVETGLSTTYQQQDIIWTITVPATSQKTYDNAEAACLVGGCNKKTNAWKISNWVVEE